ncbi:MAG: hypothetical protein HYU77_10695 [Betaproteobacteria bacterium]|nr:hypothetical protein [Betaproteobacteria bacterium]
MLPMSLTPAQQRRLEKLATDAGRTPHAMLRFVLRDGFDFCEWEVREGTAAERDANRRGYIPHQEVKRQVKAVLAGPCPEGPCGGLSGHHAPLKPT